MENESEELLAYHKWYLENRSNLIDSSPEIMVKMYLAIKNKTDKN